MVKCTINENQIRSGIEAKKNARAFFLQSNSFIRLARSFSHSGMFDFVRFFFTQTLRRTIWKSFITLKKKRGKVEKNQKQKCLKTWIKSKFCFHSFFKPVFVCHRIPRIRGQIRRKNWFHCFLSLTSPFQKKTHSPGRRNQESVVNPESDRRLLCPQTHCFLYLVSQLPQASLVSSCWVPFSKPRVRLTMATAGLG